MKKLWHDKAWAEYSEWQTRDKKTLKRINLILKSIERDGYGCIGKPEPLKGNLSGKWSVRIDDVNRLIFSIGIPLFLGFIALNWWLSFRIFSLKQAIEPRVSLKGLLNKVRS